MKNLMGLKSLLRQTKGLKRQTKVKIKQMKSKIGKGEIGIEKIGKGKAKKTLTGHHAFQGGSENLLVKRLRSQRGASITFALFLFLVCAVISSIVLVAGTASSGRMANLVSSDQKYYNVTSAAKMLKEMLGGKTVVVERTLVTKQLWHHDGSTGTDAIATTEGEEGVSEEVEPVKVKDSTSFAIDDGKTSLASSDYVMIETTYEEGVIEETTIQKYRASDDAVLETAEEAIKKSFLLDAAQRLLETSEISEEIKRADGTLYCNIYKAEALYDEEEEEEAEEEEDSEEEEDKSVNTLVVASRASGSSGGAENPLENQVVLLTETLGEDYSITFLIRNGKVKEEDSEEEDTEEEDSEGEDTEEETAAVEYVEDPDNILRMTLKFECNSHVNEGTSTSDGDRMSITQGSDGSTSYDYYKTTTEKTVTKLKWSLASVESGG